MLHKIDVLQYSSKNRAVSLMCYIRPLLCPLFNVQCSVVKYSNKYIPPLKELCTHIFDTYFCFKDSGTFSSWQGSFHILKILLLQKVCKHTQVLFSPDCSFIICEKPSKFAVGVSVVNNYTLTPCPRSQPLSRHRVCIVNH